MNVPLGFWLTTVAALLRAQARTLHNSMWHGSPSRRAASVAVVISVVLAWWAVFAGCRYGLERMVR